MEHTDICLIYLDKLDDGSYFLAKETRTVCNTQPNNYEIFKFPLVMDETQLFSRVKVPTTFKNSNGQILLCMVDGWIEQQVHWALIDVCQVQQLQHTPSLMPH